ncbi:MAG TPA: hypothetical protein VF424_02125, partial [Vicinamibacterales bacterium]
MRSRVSIVALCLVVAVSAVSGQSGTSGQGQSSSPDALWRRALDAWDAGQYPNALKDLQALMRSPAAAQYLERVALLTGELFVTTGLSNDGRNPRISADGQVATYETGDPKDP